MTAALTAMTMTLAMLFPGSAHSTADPAKAVRAKQVRQVAQVGPATAPDRDPGPAPIPDVWLRLAECESHGEWDYGPHSGWGSGLYHGGLQFDPGTWTAFAPDHFPDLAYDATPHQQVEVAERVLAAQGWKAWPACSRKLGLR